MRTNGQTESGTESKKCEQKVLGRCINQDLTTGQRSFTQRKKDHRGWRSENDAHFIIHPNLRVPRCAISERNIQVTVITLIWCTREAAFDGVACVDEDSRRGVKHSLSTVREDEMQVVKVGYILPMGVLCMWTSGELCFLMRACKEDVEPRYEGVNV